MSTNIESRKPSVPDENKYSWQAWQEMYRTFTHKSDTLTKNFERANLYTYHDVEELHDKLLQISETYDIVENSHNLVITYADNEKLTFSNFEGFKAKNASRTSAVRSITLVHNYLIKHSQTNNPNNYRISIDILSSAALDEDLKNNKPLRRFFLLSWGSMTGRCEIEHVDFVIAQNFMNSTSDWFSSRKSMESSNFIKFIQNYIGIIPILSRNLFTLIFAYSTYRFVEAYQYYDSLHQLIILAIAALSLGCVIREISYRAGTLLEFDVRSIIQHSFISLTRGDQDLIEQARKHNQTNKYKAITNFVSQIVIGLIISIIAP